jgi:hypothetical protein
MDMDAACSSLFPIDESLPKKLWPEGNEEGLDGFGFGFGGPPEGRPRRGEGEGEGEGEDDRACI